VHIDIVNNPSIEQLKLRSSSTPAAGFEQILAASQAKADKSDKADQTRADQARKAAEQFVSSAFMLPMLEQMRNDPLRSDLFNSGFAEEAFQSQLDTILADRITSGSSFPLVDSILDYVLKNQRKPQDRIESAPLTVDRSDTRE